MSYILHDLDSPLCFQGREEGNGHSRAILKSRIQEGEENLLDGCDFLFFVGERVAIWGRGILRFFRMKR